MMMILAGTKTHDRAALICKGHEVKLRGEHEIVKDPNRPNGTPRKLMSADKLKALGWQPKIGTFINDAEKDLIKGLEADDAEFKCHLTAKRRTELHDIAHATMNDEREKITLRISRKDLIRIKSRALQEGLPYQTLINSILHKAVSD